jgi:8-oxo-dGTP diphosphatase
MNKGVKVVIKNDKGELLVLKRRDDDELDPGRWDFPGGGVERGEELRDTAKREVREETDLDIKPEDQYFATYYFPDGKEESAEAVIYSFRATIVTGVFRLNGESADYGWVSMDNWRKFSYTANCKAVLENYFN